MKITFKDVQQGDSIIIEWTDKNGMGKIGVIDCHLRGDENPVLDYIKSKQYPEIAFLILSHPHNDHFSGYLGLLEYLEQNKILIRRFAHTVGFDGAGTYWKFFEWDTQAEILLDKIKKKWATLKENGLLERLSHLDDEKVLLIDDTVTIKCLAPSHDDFLAYQRKVRMNAEQNVSEARQAANLLSTILKIEIDDYAFLFTSDAEKSALEGAIGRDLGHFNDAKFHICQMPHHGSKANHSTTFWDGIACFQIQNAVASAGKGYNHPSVDVLRDFKKRGYEVYCTNIVNGMATFVNELEDAKRALDDFSEIAEEYRKANDRVFVLSEGNVILQK